MSGTITKNEGRRLALRLAYGLGLGGLNGTSRIVFSSMIIKKKIFQHGAKNAFMIEVP
jgi:hypothetical protein